MIIELSIPPRQQPVPAAHPDFPHAPLDWNPAEAQKAAQREGLALTAAHWEEIRCLQEYFARHDHLPAISCRELHDALDEHFHSRGGLKMLYRMFPGGPIAQGCRLAGLKRPCMAEDFGHGSVA